ncbi:Phosphatidylserine decarboxylase [Zostera marina]|uniref:Phosphatidylserine decarboxylase proenzyme 2 n=1 Tax=Zostera marina TaxID=29655 RepID=A0A0K9PM36_ZOSMR|nr:Phosphatidylserine decarboxylase [Zostera marina]
MGNETSKSSSSDSSSGEGSSSRLARYSKRLHRPRRHRSVIKCDSDPLTKAVSQLDFAGIASIQLIKAKMEFQDKWLACLSVGERTYRSPISENTDKPVWETKKSVVLEIGGPRIARISVYETNTFSRNTLVGFCEIDLSEMIGQNMGSESREIKLSDPSSSGKFVGTITISCNIENPIEVEKSFARRVLTIADHNGDGHLSRSEFTELIDVFGNDIAHTKKEEIFKLADTNCDGVVSIDELAILLTEQQEKEPIINSCPVCGEILGKNDRLNNIIHLTLCFDEGTGNQKMTGGFLTDKQAAYGWAFKLSEWAHFSTYNVGLNSGSSASHIVVFDRRTKRLVQELIDGKIVMSMRTLYQSKIGITLIDKGAKDFLRYLSEKQGTQMNSLESAEEIPQFIDFFKDQINVDDVKYPIKHFKTFNEFFIRELKPGARPIYCPENNHISVCAADSRLMAFKCIDDSLRFWIKGRKFSIKGLLGTDVSSDAFTNGSLVIFRLAPQDYHRFHVPVSGVIEQFTEIPGSLYTVNPIAVNSKYCNVFTENKRVVSTISTKEFGKVAFVAIGATMVGSITFTRKKGDHVTKGDEFGYFSFGGSTVICVFEKDSIKIDEDLLGNSERSLETLVSMGMRLGESTRT